MEEKYSLTLVPHDARVERVTAIEVYLIRGSTRFKRICGSNATYSGNVCTYDAGYRTDHPARGFCWLHETTASVAAWNQIVSQGDDNDRPLVRYLRNAASITPHQLRELDGDIMFLHALVGQAQDGKTILSSADLELIRKILADIVKAKETKAKIERDIKFEAESIKNFVNQVFSVVVSQLDPATARRIMNLVMDKVILPLEATDKISGDIKDLHSSVRGLQTEVDKKTSRKSHTPRSSVES